MEVKNTKFEKKFWSGVMLEDFYQDVKSGSFKSIYGDLFINAMEEWILSDVTQAVMAVEFVKSGTKERVMTAIQNSTMVSQSRLQEGLSKLSVIATTAPFIGLLGTVWGIPKVSSHFTQSARVIILSHSGNSGSDQCGLLALMRVARPASSKLIPKIWVSFVFIL
jgi:biopolymer transport protein ExbB/TolQ